MDWIAQLTQAGITSGVALVASYFGAKWAESRKLEARFEKLDRIREEMREVTRVQEDIKGQLQSGEWNRQNLWRQQLESYTEMLQRSTDYLEACNALRAALAAESGSEEVSGCRAEVRRTRKDTFKTVTVVEIFGDDEVLRTLRKFFEGIGEAQSGESVALLSREMDAIRHLQTTFVAIARAQLRSRIDREAFPPPR